MRKPPSEYIEVNNETNEIIVEEELLSLFTDYMKNPRLIAINKLHTFGIILILTILIVIIWLLEPKLTPIGLAGLLGIVFMEIYSRKMKRRLIKLDSFAQEMQFGQKVLTEELPPRDEFDEIMKFKWADDIEEWEVFLKVFLFKLNLLHEIDFREKSLDDFEIVVVEG
jgi:hypothetical protein